MKQNKVLKSLAELSPEFLGGETAKTDQATPEQPQPVTQEMRPIFQPIRFLTEADTRAYRGWGLNE